MKWLIPLALLLAPGLATAAPRPEREMIEIKAGAPFVMKPDKAYILFRTFRPKGVASFEPVLLRIPSAGEMTAYNQAKQAAFAQEEAGLVAERQKQLDAKADADKAGKPFKGTVPPVPALANFNFTWAGASNLENIDDSGAFVKAEGGNTYLVEVKPGDYILYGAQFGLGLFKPGLHVCFCLGTVGFGAKAGEITDLGTFMADVAKFESKIPELKAESNFGPSSDPLLTLIVATMKPLTPDMAKPAGIEGAKLAAADYRAVGRYFNPGAMGINRLVPVPGVLAYDEEHVIDVKTGKRVPDSY